MSEAQTAAPVAAPKHKPLSKAEAMEWLERIADAKAGHARTTDVREEKVGLAAQAHALRECLRHMRG